MSEGPLPSLVVDSSTLVALLADPGPAGSWAAASISGALLCAPHLVLFETANVLRRHKLAGLLDEAEAALAHADLLSLPLQLWPYAVLSERCWQLRENLTVYDACYVALAELLGATLVTLDARIAGAPGTRCPVVAYPGGPPTATPPSPLS